MAFDLTGYHLTLSEDFDVIGNWNFTQFPADKSKGLWQPTMNWNNRRLSGVSDQQIYTDPSFTGQGQQQSLPGTGTPLGLNPYSIDTPSILTITGDYVPDNLFNANLTFGQPFMSGGFCNWQTWSQSSSMGSYYEARIQMPVNASGNTGPFWPGWWLLPDGQQWPPEIDIVEAVGTGSNNPTVVQTPHYIDGSFTPFGYNSGVDVRRGFHNYGAYVGYDKIEFYFDGIKTYTQPPIIPSGNQSWWSGGWFVLVQFGIGGSWPGIVQPPYRTNIDLPGKMYVDWIRCYSKNPADPVWDPAVYGRTGTAPPPPPTPPPPPPPAPPPPAPPPPAPPPPPPPSPTPDDPPAPVTLTSRGILIEPARSNLATNGVGGSFVGSSWFRDRVTVNNTTRLAPDGSNSAIELLGIHATDSYIRLTFSGLTPGQDYCWSCWIKTPINQIPFFLALKESNSSLFAGSLAITINSTWQRFSTTWKVGSDGVIVGYIGGNTTWVNSTQYVRIWNPVLEAGTKPTSTIPCGTTRTDVGADQVQIAVPNGTYDIRVVNPDSTSSLYSQVPITSGVYPVIPNTGWSHVYQVIFGGGTSTLPTNVLNISATATVDVNGGSLLLGVVATGPGTCSCGFSTSNGTATAGVDYQATTGTLTWPVLTGPAPSPGFGGLDQSNPAMQVIEIPLIPTTASNPPRTFSVTLSFPTGATLSNSVAIVTLTNGNAGSRPAQLADHLEMSGYGMSTGAADNTAAFNAMAAACVAQNKFFAQNGGTFNFANAITAPAGLQILGRGDQGAVFNFTNPANSGIVLKSGANIFQLKVTTAATSRIDSISSAAFVLTGSGASVWSCWISTVAGPAIVADAATNFEISGCAFNNLNAGGIKIQNGSAAGRIHDCSISVPADDGIRVESLLVQNATCANLSIFNNSITAPQTGHGISVYGGESIDIFGNTVSTGGSTKAALAAGLDSAVNVQSTSHVVFRDNTVSGLGSATASQMMVMALPTNTSSTVSNVRFERNTGTSASVSGMGVIGTNLSTCYFTGNTINTAGNVGLYLQAASAGTVAATGNTISAPAVDGMTLNGPTGKVLLDSNTFTNLKNGTTVIKNPTSTAEAVLQVTNTILNQTNGQSPATFLTLPNATQTYISNAPTGLPSTIPANNGPVPPTALSVTVAGVLKPALATFVIDTTVLLAGAPAGTVVVSAGTGINCKPVLNFLGSAVTVYPASSTSGSFRYVIQDQTGRVAYSTCTLTP